MADVKNLPAEDRVEYANRYLKALTANQQLDPNALIEQNKSLYSAALAAGVPTDAAETARMGSLGMAASGLAGVMGPDEVFRRRSQILRSKGAQAGFNIPLGPGFGAGPFGIMSPMHAYRMLGSMYPGKTTAQIEAEIDASFMPASINPSVPDAPQDQPTASVLRVLRAIPPREELPPTTDPDELWRRAMAESARAGSQWGKGVRQAQPPSATRAPIMEVHIVKDSRPSQVNAGE
jgi:hypothetical protein